MSFKTNKVHMASVFSILLPKFGIYFPILVSRISSQLIVAQWRHLAWAILIHTGSSNGILPDDTEPQSEPMFTYHSQDNFKIISG